MKILAPLALAATVSAPLFAADAPTEQKDKVSYSIGANIGSSLKSDGIDVNPEMLQRGMSDAFNGVKLQLSQEEMMQTMQAFQTEMRGKMAAQRTAMGEKNKSAGEAFLAENKKKDGVKTTKSGLQYKVLTEGKGEKPKATDTVSTNYRGTLIDGTEFDSSAKHGGPASFPVNAVIPGWTEALQMMPVGSKWQLAIPPSIAYGESGQGPITPNSTLLFDVELLKIEKSGAAEKADAPKEK